MTRNDLESCLHLFYPKTKWKAKEQLGSIEISIAKYITSPIVVQLEELRPANVLFIYRTMGFWERLFCFKSGWKN